MANDCVCDLSKWDEGLANIFNLKHKDVRILLHSVTKEALHCGHGKNCDIFLLFMLPQDIFTMFSVEAGEGFPSSGVDELSPKKYEGEETDFIPGVLIRGDVGPEVDL